MYFLGDGVTTRPLLVVARLLAFFRVPTAVMMEEEAPDSPLWFVPVVIVLSLENLCKTNTAKYV